jgi:transposase
VLADTLRTDGHRWKPLRPDTEPTRALRALCRSRKDLVQTRVQVLGQLRANLELAFPGAIGLFTKPASGISLEFLRRFPTAAKAAWLSPRRLDIWLRSVGYTGGISAAVLHSRLAAAAPGLAGPEGEARGQITLALVAMLTALNEQITVLDTGIATMLAAHPDKHIFASLPRSGTIRAATLLAEIGDSGRGSPPMTRSPRWPGRAPRRGSRASAARRYSAGHAARNSAPPSWTSPTAAPERPLGRQRLRRRDRAWLPASARHPDPGPGLVADHLALLARQRSLRPSSPPQPPRRRYLT